jgi:hypothetical protein
MTRTYRRYRYVHSVQGGDGVVDGLGDRCEEVAVVGGEVAWIGETRDERASRSDGHDPDRAAADDGCASEDGEANRRARGAFVGTVVFAFERLRLRGAVIAAATAFSGAPMADDAAVLVVRVPDDANVAPLDRLAAATGTAAEDLRLPGYPHDTGPPVRR